MPTALAMMGFGFVVTPLRPLPPNTRTQPPKPGD
ncbi:MAG: hypothetical protein ACTHN5_15395 [Phycisphaerae bacterium]